MFNTRERPRGHQVEAFRLRCLLRGRAPTQEEFADAIDLPYETYRVYVGEKRGTLMPSHTWTLLRITWDALMLAQWQRQRPKHEEEE